MFLVLLKPEQPFHFLSACYSPRSCISGGTLTSSVYDLCVLPSDLCTLPSDLHALSPDLTTLPPDLTTLPSDLPHLLTERSQCVTVGSLGPFTDEGLQ